ncbi:MAG: riboflavin synthase [Bacteroidetes bacterium]|nr:riboflavin synthase [Bacteroidota bacterium]
MFTGIIEATGKVKDIIINGSNTSFVIESPISEELKPDQSLSHNGVCLTVEKISSGTHYVTAIAETLKKTNLGDWKKSNSINLERCLKMDGRLDGHIVQGHVDATAVCTDRKELDGSWEFCFEFPKKFNHLIIEKGSICLNGISLTIFNVTKKHFWVAIIPYTFSHTNMQQLFPGDRVNLEFDIVGKYINRMLSLKD